MKIFLMSMILLPTCLFTAVITAGAKKAAQKQRVALAQKLPPVEYIINDVKITILHGDILTLKVDAIVNAANPNLAHGGGISGKIFDAAQGKKGHELAKYIADNIETPIDVGTYAVTPSFNLKAAQGVSFIIHAIGPNCTIQEQKQHFEKTLYDLYDSILDMNTTLITSIAFPFVSGELYRCPKEQVAKAELQAGIDYAQKGAKNITEIYYVLWTPEDFKLFVRVFNQLVNKAPQEERQAGGISSVLEKLKNSLEQLHDQLTGSNITSLIW